MKDIAAAAGVSRQLVYFLHGSRAGLLLAMAATATTRTASARAWPRRARCRPPRRWRRSRAWCAYLPDLLPVARALEAALVTGDEGGDAWRDRMTELHAVIRRAVARVADAGALAPDWTPGTAADWLWAGLQPSGYAHLVEERGWTHHAYVERTVASLLDAVLAGRAD